MDGTQFTVYLPSSSANYYNRANVPSNYAVKLPDTINLVDPSLWECGLWSINFKKSWRNYELINDIIYNEKTIGEKGEEIWTETKFTLPDIEYDGAEALVEELNANIPGATDRSKKVRFVYLDHTDRVVYQVKNPANVDKVRVVLGLKLSKLLGFEKRTLQGKEKILAVGKPRITSDIDSLFIYTDIIEPIIVGSEYLKLLRSVPIPDSAVYNDNVYVEFDKVIYMPIASSKTRFDTIHVTLALRREIIRSVSKTRMM